MPPSPSVECSSLYQRLPSGFRGFLRVHSTWLAENDHLLLVDSSRFSETYKRFYLADIQAIVIRKTTRFKVPCYWIVLALVAAIFLLASATRFRPWTFWPAVAILTGEAIYLYIAAMFESCTCHLITRVSNVELPSLFRLRDARKFAALMTPRLVAAQGELPAGWVERTAMLPETATAADRNPEHAIDLLPAGGFSWITVAVFGFVLLDAALTIASLRSGNPEVLAKPNLFNMLLLAVCATIAIVQLSRRKAAKQLRILVIASLFTVAGITYASVLLESIDQQIFHQTFKNILDYPGMRALAIAEIAADFVVAIAGLLFAFRQPQSLKPTGLGLNDPIKESQP